MALKNFDGEQSWYAIGPRVCQDCKKETLHEWGWLNCKLNVLICTKCNRLVVLNGKEKEDDNMGS